MENEKPKFTEMLCGNCKHFRPDPNAPDQVQKGFCTMPYPMWCIGSNAVRANKFAYKCECWQFKDDKDAKD